MDRLRRDGRIRKAEYAFGYAALQREKIIGTGKPDQAPNPARIDRGGAQMFGIERQHGRVVRTRGVAHEKYTLRIAAELCDAIEGPAHGRAAICQKVGKANFGIESVVRNDCSKAFRGERFADEEVIAPVPRVPVTAVEEPITARPSLIAPADRRPTFATCTPTRIAVVRRRFGGTAALTIAIGRSRRRRGAAAVPP